MLNIYNIVTIRTQHHVVSNLSPQHIVYSLLSRIGIDCIDYIPLSIIYIMKYIVYGPLLGGATTLMFEGVPTYPNPGRFWDVIDKYNVNQFYMISN